MLDLRWGLTLLPFVYTARTRLKSGRDYLYLIASQWGLGLIVLYLLGTGDYSSTLANYALGYLAFISIYEVGYLVNDVWDSKRASDGRARFDGEVTVVFFFFFLCIRIGFWIYLTVFFQQGELLFWVAANIALVIVFATHNLLGSPELRYASFFQLALLRFALPLIFSLPSYALEQIIIVTVLHYLYFRSLAYLDSKSLLAMPHRKNPDFGFKHTTIMGPIVGCLYLATDSVLYPAAWGYTAATYIVFLLSSRRAK